MKKIQMVDLRGQMSEIREEIDQLFDQVLDHTAFINGSEVDKFKRDLAKYLGVKHVIACANGTDALQIAMMALGLKRGDEVITSDFTFAATVEVIALLGLTPVLVDVDKDTFNINVGAISKAITPKTKAIVPVHLYGRPAQMEEIMKIAKEHNLFVIEDNAQSIGADYTWSDGTKQKAGTIGHVGATSFFPSKNLGCYGDGGALFTNDDNLAHILTGIVNHGMYVRYHHDVVGVNSRLDSLQACVLNAKLPHLDSYNRKRREAAKQYSKALYGIEGIITPEILEGDTDHVFHQYTLLIENGKRDVVAKALSDNSIPFGIYYPIPLHRQKAYADSRYREEDFTVTNQIVNEVISLPMHTELDQEQIEFITSVVKKAVMK